MRNLAIVTLSLVSIGLAGALAWSLGRSPTAATPLAARDMPRTATHRNGTAIEPIPQSLDVDKPKARLGRRLFHDVRLSRSETVSCATCHDPENGGDDGRVVSIGAGDRAGSINAPTILNARFNFAQFWDGRAETLEDQVDGPLTHPNEMDSNWDLIMSRLAADPQYRSEFEASYSDGLTIENIRLSIAEYERSLITPNSRFDRFQRGETDILNDDERRGWELFQDIGCTSCHQGLNLGGNMFQSFGVIGDYFKDRGDVTPADLGRFNVTQLPRDKFRFKVPTLRNIELTAPYFHDGSQPTLEGAIQVMARYQLGIELEQGDADHMVAFLKTLTADVLPLDK